MIETIRELVTRRVEKTSLRQVAKQIGMSPAGLSKFMGGTKPYRGTVGKLESWYLREQSQDANASTEAGTIAVALRVLARAVPPSRRSGFVEAVTADLRASIGSEDAVLAQLGEHDAYIRAV